MDSKSKEPMKKTCKFCLKEFHWRGHYFHQRKCEKDKNRTKIQKDKKLIVVVKRLKYCCGKAYTIPWEFKLHQKIHHRSGLEIKEDSIALDEDPRIVKSLFKCPVCLKYLLHEHEAEDHVEKYHRISQENQVRMNLKIIEEIPIVI